MIRGRGPRGAGGPAIVVGTALFIAALAAPPLGTAGTAPLVVAAGAYRLAVVLSSSVPTAGRPLDVLVERARGGPALTGVTVTLRGRPGRGTPGTATRAVVMRPAPDPGVLRGRVELPVRGSWDLVFYVSGPAGDGVGALGVTAGVAGAMPVWAGWLIGLSPLLGLAWFAWWNHGYLQRLRKEDETTP